MVSRKPEDAIRRPGFGLDLAYMPPLGRKYGPVTRWRRFPHAIVDRFVYEGVTLQEQRMLEFVNQISDKPRWWEKINDENIISRWWAEAGGEDDLLQRTSPDHLSKRCFDYCMAELRDKASYMQKHGAIHVLDVNVTVVKADITSDDNFWLDLKRCAWKLEDVPDRYKDWHPGSGDLVLDLLHPSLFPLRYGKSRVLRQGFVPVKNCTSFTGLGEFCPVPDLISQGNPSRNDYRHRWRNYASLPAFGRTQWLPSEISFGGDGEANVTSYINNLHPEVHRELYHVLEQAIDRALPLWNECLSWWFDRTRLRPGKIGLDSFIAPSYPGLKSPEYNGADERDSGEDEGEYIAGEAQRRELERQNDFEEWLLNNPKERLLLQPEPGEYQTFDHRIDEHGISRIDLRNMFAGGLQVIFKLANVHLTPAKLTYEGSNWHVEGAPNEHICATALFYYDSENITDNFLEFRQRMDANAMMENLPQDEYAAAENCYGIKNEEAAVQKIGHVLTRPGRWIAFSNIMQHKVSPFSLADPTKPGHRKILALFLVDPHIKILSTANVPPQRMDWWAEEVKKTAPFSDLPVELFECLMQAVDDFPIDWDTACETREELMEERGWITEREEERLQDDTFSFCEH